MFTTVHLGAFLNNQTKRNSTGSTISTISNENQSSSSMSSLNLPINDGENNNEPMTLLSSTTTPNSEIRRSRYKSTNSQEQNGFGGSNFWTATNSFWKNGSRKTVESIKDCDSQIRRISMPLQKIRRKSHSAVRRLSNIYNQLETVVTKEFLLNGL